MPSGFNCPGFMDCDMPAFRGEYALVWPQDGGYDDFIGLGSPNKQVDISPWGIAGLLDKQAGPVAILVSPITRVLLIIGFNNPL